MNKDMGNWPISWKRNYFECDFFLRGPILETRAAPAHPKPPPLLPEYPAPGKWVQPHPRPSCYLSPLFYHYEIQKRRPVPMKRTTKFKSNRSQFLVVNGWIRLITEAFYFLAKVFSRVGRSLRTFKNKKTLSYRTKSGTLDERRHSFLAVFRKQPL